MTTLEPIYLMNVVLYFPSYSDVKRFLRINKKCKETVERLKITPLFTENTYVELFHKHFTTDTIDQRNIPIHNLSILKNATLIRNFDMVNEQIQQNKEFALEMVKKVHTLQLNGTSICTFAIENARHFENLYKIYGSLELIRNFLKNYTNNGKEKYISFPRLILITNYSYFTRLEVDEECIRIIEEIINYVKESDRTEIVAVFEKHPQMSYENQQLLKRLRGVTYFHEYFPSDYEKYMSENYACEGGIIKMEYNPIDNNHMNEVIDLTYAETIECFNSQLMNRTRQTEDSESEMREWTLPDHVKTFVYNEGVHYFYQRVTERKQLNQGQGKILSLVQTFQDLSYITPFGKTKENMDINNIFDFLHDHFVIFDLFFLGFIH